MSYNLTDSAQTIPGAKTFSGGIILATSGGTPGTLTYYEEYTSSPIFTGIWASGQTTTLKLTRVGKLVSLHIQGISATANTVARIAATTGTVPSRFLNASELPTTDYIRSNTIIEDNGNYAQGILIITGNGGFTIGTNANVANFSGTGASGFCHINISWSL